MSSNDVAAGRNALDALFAEIDSGDIESLIRRFAPEGTQRFGNAEPLRGHEAIREGNLSFLGMLDGIRHEIVTVVVSDVTTVIELKVTYRYAGRQPVTIPVVTAFDTGADGLITDYRVYFDIAPVFGGAE